MQLVGIDLSAVIPAACRYLGIEEKELARRFNGDRSSISRATQKESRDPELRKPPKRYKENSKKSTLKVPYFLRTRPVTFYSTSYFLIIGKPPTNKYCDFLSFLSTAIIACVLPITSL